MMRKLLLLCGIAAAVWWVAMDIVGSLRYPGYSYADQAISELSADGAPTRAFMLAASAIPYAIILVGFGAGVWLSAGGRAGRIAGALIAFEAVWGATGGIAFPMAAREVSAAGQDTLRNQLHGWYGIAMPLLFALAISVGSGLLGGRFRQYSYATLLAMLVFGLLMSPQVSAVAANEPTPWLGVKERVTAYAPMLWFVVLAIGLLRAGAAKRPRPLASPRVRPQMAPR